MSDKKEIILLPADKIEGIECEEVTLEEAIELKEIGEQMIEYCANNGGAGLAAPQIGIFKNMFVWMNSANSFQIVYNPRYFKDGKKTNVIEGCLSYPDENYYLQRWKRISAVSFVIHEGEFKKLTQHLSGERAFIFQHETDHLSGKTIAIEGLKLDEKMREKVGLTRSNPAT